MKNAVKAMLWSGLVFPGLGQLVLKYYKRGIALALATAACSYVLVAKVANAIQQAMAIVDKIDFSSGVVDVQAITTAVSEADKASGSGATQFVVWILLILWLIGMVDAYVMGRRKDRLASGRTGKDNK